MSSRTEPLNQTGRTTIAMLPSDEIDYVYFSEEEEGEPLMVEFSPPIEGYGQVLRTFEVAPPGKPPIGVDAVNRVTVRSYKGRPSFSVYEVFLPQEGESMPTGVSLGGKGTDLNVAARKVQGAKRAMMSTNESWELLDSVSGMIRPAYESGRVGWEDSAWEWMRDLAPESQPEAFSRWLCAMLCGYGVSVRSLPRTSGHRPRDPAAILVVEGVMRAEAYFSFRDSYGRFTWPPISLRAGTTHALILAFEPGSVRLSVVPSSSFRGAPTAWLSQGSGYIREAQGGTFHQGMEVLLGTVQEMLIEAKLALPEGGAVPS